MGRSAGSRALRQFSQSFAGLTSALMVSLGLLGLGILPVAHAQRALLPSTAPGGGVDEGGGVELDAASRDRVVAFVSAHPSFAGTKVQVTVGRVRQQPPDCAKPPSLAFSGNARPWGGASVVMQCVSPQWAISVPVQTKVMGQVVVSNRDITAGSRPSAEDFRLETRDITRSPPDVVRSVVEVENRHVARPITADAVVQLNNFREPAVVKERDNVRVQIVGTGFQVIGEGLALSAGGIGELIRVRMPDGQVVQAKVIRQGFVEISK